MESEEGVDRSEAGNMEIVQPQLRSSARAKLGQAINSLTICRGFDGNHVSEEYLVLIEFLTKVTAAESCCMSGILSTRAVG